MLNKTSTLFAWLLLLLGVVYYFINYNSLPDQIPTHFNVRGEADGFGSKTTAWFFFGILAFVLGVLSFVKKADPSVLNYPVQISKENLPAVHKLSLELLSVIQIWIGGLSLLVSRKFVTAALEGNEHSSPSFWIYIIFLFLVIGLYIFRMRQHK